MQKKISDLTIKLKVLENEQVQLSLFGHIDAETAPLLREKIALLQTDGYKKIILDFHKISHLSSQGVTVLVENALNLKKIGGEIVLQGLNGRPKLVVEDLNLANILSIV